MLMNYLKSPAWWAGIGVAVLVAVSAGYAADWVGTSVLGFGTSPISAIMMAILIGIVIGNVFTLPQGLRDGLRFCSSTILKLGIILLGIRLSLFGAGKFTLVALPFVIAAIAIALLTVGFLGRRLGLSRQLAGLIAIGTSICGCTAIVATAPLIKANDAEVSYAVACVTLFGVVAMFSYPLLAHYAFAANPELAGLFLGTSIHETAQVAGAGMMYEAQYNAPRALDIATVTKLVRNLCMVAVVPIVGILYGGERTSGQSTRVNWLRMIPWFIVGFAAMSALRTVGDFGDQAFGFMNTETWGAIVERVKFAAEACLLIAMSAVGLTSALAGIIRIGLRPFVLGLFAAVLTGVVSFLLIANYAESLLQALS